MQIQFSYNKAQVLRALRLHFVTKPDIKIMMIFVNVYAVTSGIFFYMKKIRPEPFLLGTFIWILVIILVWYVLPYVIYNKSTVFKEEFDIFINDDEITLHTHKGYTAWQWNMFSKWMESRYFFHLYFDSKTFFLLPKDAMDKTTENEIRKMFKTKIK